MESPSYMKAMTDAFMPPAWVKVALADWEGRAHMAEDRCDELTHQLDDARRAIADLSRKLAEQRTIHTLEKEVAELTWRLSRHDDALFAKEENRLMVNIDDARELTFKLLADYLKQLEQLKQIDGSRELSLAFTAAQESEGWLFRHANQPSGS